MSFFVLQTMLTNNLGSKYINAKDDFWIRVIWERNANYENLLSRMLLAITWNFTLDDEVNFSLASLIRSRELVDFCTLMRLIPEETRDQSAV